MLDVGCGTGRLAAALAERFACKVWAVDREPEMVEVARARVPRGVAVKVAEAERLPFRDGWFERATMTLAAHHLDRPTAFAEARRVVGAGGRLALLTFDPGSFAASYLNDFFPSIRAVDERRFPTAAALERDLLGAGFGSVEATPHERRQTIRRDDALAKIRGRHISTFQLIPEDEYAAGLARAERELPAEVAVSYGWLVVVASA